jgi:putative spermidine/putrescine transport system substrate-binding protein
LRNDRAPWLLAGHVRSLAVVGLLLTALAAATAAGCTQGRGGAGTVEIEGLGSSVREIRRLARAEGSLELVVWPGYAEGAWIRAFTRQTGCEVNAKEAVDSTDMLSLFRTGDYDGVSASGDVSGLLMADGEVAPVDPGRIPNYDLVLEGVKNRSFNSREGQPYGMPQSRAANLLMFRTDAVPEETESWDVIWDRARRYSGRLSISDDAIFIADAALYLKATRPDLGIEDPYQLNEDQFQAALDLLRAQAPHVGEYWSRSESTQVASFRSGESVLGTTRPERLRAMEDAGIPVRAVKPEEGATGWSDTWMVSSSARDPNCTYLWMDYVVSPGVQAQIAESLEQAPVNLAACQLTKDRDHCAKLQASDEAWWEDVHYWTTPSADCGDPIREETCKTLDDWKTAWTEIRGS